MRVMVTGAAGFIGSSLVERLLQKGHSVEAVDNLDDYYPGKRERLEAHLDDPNFRPHEIDILDMRSLSLAMRGCQVVLHMAAQAGVRASIADPMKTYDVNVIGTLNVLAAAREAGVRRVVNSSSSSVYGNAPSLPVDEASPVQPISPYAASKLSAEEYCGLFTRLYGLETVSLRYFTVYGPRQRPDMAIRIFVDRLARGLPPQIYGDGSQTRDFTYIDDVIEAVLLCIEGEIPNGGALNICSGGNISINELTSLIGRLMGREEIKPEYLPAQPGDVDDTWGNNAKARSMLGWSPRTDTETGLRNFIDWYLSS
jgi:UDP-glucose 4-epimerase